MAIIRLPKLPDRNPVKLAVSLTPDLSEALGRYARYYEHSYGRAETVADLAPAMLAAFLESDRGFRRWRKGDRA